MRVIYSGICDIGLKRQKNQDSVYMYWDEIQKMGLFVIADGMGSHAKGELASTLITNRIKIWVDNFMIEHYNNKFTQMIKSLENKIEEINRDIYHNYSCEQICGSTCVLLFIYEKNYGVINVGDSRIYKKNGWKITSIMKDDVWENKIDIQETMSEKDILNHANFGKLLQAVGSQENVFTTTKTDFLKRGDCFLLCSDGLYKCCSEKDMMNALKNMNRFNINDSVRRLVAKCYEEGAKDNISIILVKCI